ncbi:hypothetical protein ACJ6WF_17105 [Streptomyces sp. MMS24-I2-30]|uniref:hypothetical protein n=1 Tax=Streptomyces sp. MMS24-I2-30 TaxID=3351564 RepID=UPI0038968C10
MKTISTSSRPTPTDLPPAAIAALARLEAAFAEQTVARPAPLPPQVVEAVARYEAAAVHARDLAALAASGRMSDLDADSLAAAEDLMADARATLAAAGQLRLIEAAS